MQYELDTLSNQAFYKRFKLSELSKTIEDNHAFVALRMAKLHRVKEPEKIIGDATALFLKAINSIEDAMTAVRTEVYKSRPLYVEKLSLIHI